MSASILDQYRDQRIADYGGNAWTVYNPQTDSHATLSSEEFLSFSWLPNGSLLLVEQSHFAVPRKEMSLSQPYTEQELLNGYATLSNKGCTVRLLPQALTATARDRAGLDKKNDANDTRAWYSFIKDNPQLALMKPPASFVTEQRREASWQFRHETNLILNIARRFKYQKENDAVSMFVERNLPVFASQLSPTALEIFDLLPGKSGRLCASSSRSMRLYTIAAHFLHSNGTVRLRPDTGKMPGIKWLKRYVLGFTPFHFRGGIARSNLMFHGFKNYAKKRMNLGKDGYKTMSPEQAQQFRALRKEFTAAIVEAMQLMRQLVQAQYSVL